MKKLFYIFMCSTFLLVTSIAPAKANFFITNDMKKFTSYISEFTQKIAEVAEVIQQGIALVGVIQSIGAMGAQGQVLAVLSQIGGLNEALKSAQSGIMGLFSSDDVAAGGGEEHIGGEGSGSVGSDGDHGQYETAGSHIGGEGSGSIGSDGDHGQYETSSGSGIGGEGSAGDAAAGEAGAVQEKKESGIYPDRRPELEKLTEERNKYLAEKEAELFITEAGYTNEKIAEIKRNRLSGYQNAVAKAYTLAEDIIKRQEEKLRKMGESGVDPSSQNLRQQEIDGTKIELQKISNSIDEY